MDNIFSCCDGGQSGYFLGPVKYFNFFLACSIYEIQKAFNTLKKPSGFFTKHYPSVTGSVLILQHKEEHFQRAIKWFQLGHRVPPSSLTE